MDIAKREAIDDARRNARSNDAYQSVDKVRDTRESFSAVEDEIIHGEGLGEISEALKTKRSIDELPAKYQKVLEGFRFECVHLSLPHSSASGSLIDVSLVLQLRRDHLRGARRVRDVGHDLLKAQGAALDLPLVHRQAGAAPQGLQLHGAPAAGHPHLATARRQEPPPEVRRRLSFSREGYDERIELTHCTYRILAITLDDDPVRLAKEMDRLQTRIGSAVMVEKLNLFVHESREKKAIIRRYAGASLSLHHQEKLPRSRASS